MRSSSLIVLILTPLTLSLSACGGSGGDVSLDCGALSVGQACSISASDGSISWKLKDTKPHEEYVTIVMADRVPQSTQDLRIDFSMRSKSASDPLDSHERDAITNVIRRQGGGSDGGGVDEPIRPPRSNFQISPENIGDPLEIYVPHPGDYVTRFDNKVLPAYVHSPTGERLTGKKVGFENFATTANYFSLFYDPSFSTSGTQISFQTFANTLNTCLQRVLPQAMDLLGRPLDLDGKPEINVMLSKFDGSLGSRTLGLFSSIDRFQTSNGKKLEDSNYGEYLYLAPTTDPSRSCSTGAHELQHMISFDRKVLAQIPEAKRSDIAQKDDRDLLPEELGLDEGYSHIIEELTGESQRVSEHIYNFFTHPSLSSFALETAYSDLLGNSRSRGANTLLLYYSIRRAGGRLAIDDAITRRLLTTLISNPKIGFENIADYFGVSTHQFMQEFFQALALSLFDTTAAQNFIPPLESSKSVSNQNVSRGFKILDRASSSENIPYAPPTVHPYQFELKPLTLSDSYALPAQGMIFYRYITPATKDSDAAVEFLTGGSPFSVYVVRVR